MIKILSPENRKQGIKRLSATFISLLFLITASNAQVTGSFIVNGSINTYYPIVFTDGGYPQNVATELAIGRSAVHQDGTWRGSLIAKFSVHTYNWGNGSAFINADIVQKSGSTPVIDNFIGGWKDATSTNSTSKFIIWLRGGTTTYYYNSNYAVSPVIYDGVQNALPYQETNGPTDTYKTVVDSYVNTNGITLSNDIYANGGDNYFNGNVGIGSIDTKGYKLAVNGSAIFTKAVVKANTNWPDYVFHENYSLPKLDSLESFLKIHKHLPDVPSAADVEQEGIDVGANQKVLLQKIEELTLYIINQNKEIELLKSKMEELAKTKK